MGTAPTRIPAIDGDGFARRIAAMFPNGWSSPEAKQPGGVLYALFKTLGQQISFALDGFIYALNATRIQNAIGDALDLAAADFYGEDLGRLSGETDDAYRARILAALVTTFVLAPGATRAAISFAVKNAAGVAPRLIEPWRPTDTGVIDGLPGHGMMFFDVDTAETPARLTDPSLEYQGFCETILPFIPVINGNPLPCMDVGNNADGLYFDIAGSSMFDFESTVPLGEQVVYDAINKTKVFGTVVWTKFVNQVQ